MRRWVSGAAEAEGDGPRLSESFGGDPRLWLPLADDARDDGPPLVTLRWGPVARTVACELSPAWDTGLVRWRHLVWEPRLPDDGRGALALPRLEAQIGLVLRDGDSATVVLNGSYVPPFGVLGVAADAVALHRVADDCVAAFLRDVAARLSAVNPDEVQAA